MKAFALTAQDQPASLVELPDPHVPDDGVRIAVRSASVNGFDAFQASGALTTMMEHQLPTVIGRDFAGVVETVGAGRSDVSVGDEVLGFVPSMPPLHEGTYGQLLSNAAVVLAPKPVGLSFEDAAAIPLAGATALDSVDAAAVATGDTVLVAGATGGVGMFAVQIAAKRGATVIATARPGDEDAFVRALGASETIDYSTGDFADTVRDRFPDGLDVLIDVVNREDAFAALAEIVRDGGRIATTLGAADVEALAARGVTATNVLGAPTPEKLTSLANQVSDGSLTVEIQQTFPFEQVNAALAAFGAGTLGKIVLVM